MSKKKKQSSVATKGAGAAKHPQSAAKKSASKAPIIIGALVVIGIIAGIAMANSQGKGAGSGKPQATAEEQKYIGRLLPTGYEAPKIADAAAYTATVKMTPAKAKQGAKSVSLAVADVTKNKIVSFDYKRASGEVIPMVAYVRPSGKVFVGVSYCIPCKGTAQRIEADGTLTCATCGTKRDPETLVGISGACKLYPLDEVAAKLAGNQIVVDNAPLETWTAQPLDRKIGG